MNHNGISPDEMSVLLGKSRAEDKTTPDGLLSKFEMEVFAELLNVSFGSSSAVFSRIFSNQVSVLAPELSIKHKDEILNDIGYPSFILLGKYTGTISGIQFLLINQENVKSITQMMDKSSDTEDIEKQFQAVQDVVDQMYTAVSYSMSAVLEQEITLSLSGMDIIESREEDFNVYRFTEEGWFVQANVPLITGSRENISFTLNIPWEVAKQMVGILTDPIDGADGEEFQSKPIDGADREKVQSEPIDLAAREEEFQSMNQLNSSNQPKNTGAAPKVQSVQFSSFDENPSQQSEPNNIDLLLDIPLQVTVELGRTKRMVKEILEVSPGSIIELDKLAGEPVDILVNNKLIAIGEVVVIDDNFGVRVTDILSTADRISKLR